MQEQSNILEQKKSLRKKQLIARNRLAKEYRDTESKRICKEIIELISRANNKYKVVHCFLPMLSEVDISPLIQWLLDNDFVVIAPKTLPKRQLENRILSSLEDVEKGVFGTTHPNNSEEYSGPIDLCIIPGAAFDKDRNRLGYGGAYYDTFLAKHPKAKKIAVCFKEQMVDEVPIEAHDVQVDRIVC